MKLFFVLATLISSFAFASTEVVCQSRADVVTSDRPEMVEGDAINNRIRQLEQVGYKNIEVTHLSTSSAIGGSSASYTASIDKVCAVLKY